MNPERRSITSSINQARSRPILNGHRAATAQALPAARLPRPLAHARNGVIDINLEVLLDSAKHRETGREPTRLSRTSFRHQHWTVAQMVAHHTINGCNLQTGDVHGSGTISSPKVEEAGAMVELALNGTKPVQLSTGESRGFIEDGDAVILRGYCEKLGFARIGFGESRGEVLSARKLPG